MKLGAVIDALASVNLMSLRLAFRDSELARTYLSRCIRNYDELIGRGLVGKDPISYVQEKNWGILSPHERVEFPICLNGGGGTQFDELLYLATVTRVLRPKKIFEIGTYMGRTTSVFILNAPPDASVITLDLPSETTLDAVKHSTYIDTDVSLVQNRQLASYIHELHLESRCQQVLCDSLQFDPLPHRGSVELGFIDGAHALPYVLNDTMKMATMMADRGLVFWHDYGGKGRFRPLTRYLESLARKIPMYRVPGTTLAWTSANDLRSLAPHTDPLSRMEREVCRAPQKS